MNSWVGIIIGSLAVFSWKFIGYLVPRRFLESARLKQLAGFLTIALLAGLVGVQTFVAGSKILFDARLPALLIATILLKFKAPFILVVIAAAATAALLRLAF